MSGQDAKVIIGNNLKKLLEENDMLQRELADIVGVQESSVGKWILGKNMPRMGSIQKIADYFNVGKAEILDETTDETETIKTLNNDDHNEYCKILTNICFRMNDNGRKALLEYANFLIEKDEYKRGCIDCENKAG